MKEPVTNEWLNGKKRLTQKKNDASFHTLSSGETQASFPASFKQENWLVRL